MRFEMWNTKKCQRNDHRGGLNANKKLFLKKKVLIKMFERKDFAKTALLKRSLVSSVRSVADISDNLGF